jgi:capsular exopolysaccharide synthesis family protein
VERFDKKQQTLDVKKITRKILNNWYWLAISVGICLGVAYFKNKYSKDLYRVATSVYIKQSKDQENSAGDLLLNKNENGLSLNLYNESFFLKSRSLIGNTLKDLNFAISYFRRGKLKTTEVYKSLPIEVVYDTASTYIPYHTPIACTIKSGRTFALKSDNEALNQALGTKEYEFGKPIQIKGFRFFVKLKDTPATVNESIVFSINNFEDLVSQYHDALSISSGVKESSVLTVSLITEVPEKDIDFLNQLLVNFIDNNLVEKNSVSSKTSQLIDQLLSQNRDTLNQIQQDIERFKGRNTIVDVKTKGEQIQANIRELEQQRSSLLMANQYFTYLDNTIRQSNDFSQLVIPSNLGINDAVLSKNIEALITLQSENNLLQSDNKAKNPYFELNSKQINELKNTVLTSIRSLQAANTISLANLNKRLGALQGFQQQLPSAEREFVDIHRSFTVSEGLVSFLMQKKAEAVIARASNNPDYKVIDQARQEGGKIEPQPMTNYRNALLIGFLVPVLLIVLLDVTNNKVVTKNDLVHAIELPLLGIVGFGKQTLSINTSKYKTSILAESFRSVRTNLSFFIPEENRSNVLLFVSSVSGEGKSFCSRYLAYVLAITGKKILLINADLRKGEEGNDLEAEGFTGLSNYLSGKYNMQEVILKTKVNNLYYIKPGEIPPNPSELLLNERMNRLIEETKIHFDYIIIDTPPMGICADGLALMRFADLTIGVVRQNYTLKSFLSNLNEIYLKHKRTKMAVLFNYVDMKKLSPGNNLGYYDVGFYEKASGKSLLQKVFK